MKATKLYLAANDSDGAHLYKTMPEYDRTLDRWMPAGDKTSDILGYLNADLLHSLNIEFTVIMDVPVEVLLVVDYC